MLEGIELVLYLLFQTYLIKNNNSLKIAQTTEKILTFNLNML